MIGSAGTIGRNLRARRDSDSDMNPPLQPVSPGPLQRLLSAIVRFTLVIGGMLLMLGALMLALVLAAGVMLWALLRGRRPEPVSLHWSTLRRPPGFGRHPGAEVVDVQVREVDGPNPP